MIAPGLLIVELLTVSQINIGKDLGSVFKSKLPACKLLNSIHSLYVAFCTILINFLINYSNKYRPVVKLIIRYYNILIWYLKNVAMISIPSKYSS